MKALQIEKQKIIDEQGLARIMKETIDRTILLTAPMVRIVDQAVDDQEIKSKFERAPLLTQIRFMGHYWYMNQNKDADPGYYGLFKLKMNEWDELARDVVQFRNNICHELDYLENLSQTEQYNQITVFNQRIESLERELKTLEDAVNCPQTLETFKRNRFVDSNQLKFRLTCVNLNKSK